MAEDILEGASPTRMELLHVKNRLRLAEKGHRLLKEKRDTLLSEFMKVAREAGEVGRKAAAQMESARHAYAVSSALAGANQVEQAALASEPDLEAEVGFRNVMGIQLPIITLEARLRNIDQRGFGLITTHPSIDAAAAEYEKAVSEMITLAQTEQSLLLLSTEVKKTKRRVNALEYRVIPRLRNTQKYIRMRLEEFEREGFTRRKLVKKKRAGK